MKLLSFFQTNKNETINAIELSNIKGGKRVLEAMRSGSPEEMLIFKAKRRASRSLGTSSGTFTFRFNNEEYSVEADADSDMLHITSANGKEVCVEW